VKKQSYRTSAPLRVDEQISIHTPAESWFKVILRRFSGSPVRSVRRPSRRASFKLMYERFREILILNDSALELIADVEDLIANPRRFALGTITQRIRKSAMDVFMMVKDINQIADNRHTALYEALRNIGSALESEMAPIQGTVQEKYVMSLEEIRSIDSQLVGSKMANLGEVGGVCGFSIPGGFAITTGAFLHFMNYGQLWDKCERLEAILELEDSQGFTDACREVQSAICATPIPDDLAAAITQAFGAHFYEAGARVAMRSSAIGEDAAISSHAGLYNTELNTDASNLLDSYRSVLASAFSPAAVSYRFQRGITISDSLMAVGCVRMIRPRCAGILFSRLPDDADADAILISAVRGIAAGIASGDQNAETTVITSGRISEARESILAQDEMAALVNAARKLEFHFGRPQDVEWAIDSDGIKILQARPMTALQIKTGDKGAIVTDRAPLLEGGGVACPGVGSGPVVLLGSDEELAGFPKGGILVARHSKPAYAQIMDRCAAIVTDVGSPTGHMSSLAREFEVPAIVGMNAASRILKAGQIVTVDAAACRVYNEKIPYQAPPLRVQPLTGSPAFERFQRMARLVTPLTLTDPASREFRPDACRSLHDITRYVHEKAFEAMFHYGDIPAANDESSARLEAKLPIRVEIFDVGGGLSPFSPHQKSVRPEQVLSIPMKAFLRGLLEPRIRWDLPRPVSMRGFLSVLGESMVGRPTDANEIGRISYAIISDRYMNFSTKAGYHFSTIDTYCGKSVNKNYIHFRFLGGAAAEERRGRRIQFLSKVVAAMDFAVQVKGDALVARLDKYSAEDIQSRLVSLGRLTLCARQLDMLMDNDSSPDMFSRAFLAEEWHKF
jgi:pyruvate,water dikinase